MGAVYLPSEFGIIFLPLANVQVKAGDKLRVTCRYTHRGKAESVPLYASIGNTGAFGFNEILSASKTMSVPEDAAWQAREDYVDISITTAISSAVELGFLITACTSLTTCGITGGAILPAVKS